jgi:hypothetical protein
MFLTYARLFQPMFSPDSPEVLPISLGDTQVRHVYMSPAFGEPEAIVLWRFHWAF